MGRFSAAIACLFLVVSTAFGQAPKNNPLVDAALMIGDKGIGAAKAPKDSPTKFKPTGTRLFVNSYIASFVTDADEKKLMEAAVQEVLAELEKSAKENGFGDDAAGSLAMSLTILYTLAENAEVPDSALKLLVEDCRAVLDTPGVRASTDRQKQEFHEYALATAAVTLIMASMTPNDQQSKVRDLCKANILALTGAPSSKFKVEAGRLTLKGEAPAQASSGGLAPGFSYALPAGWQQRGGWMLKEHIDPTATYRVSTALFRFLPAIPASGNMGDALFNLWKTSVPKELDGKAGAMVYRRYVGDQLFAQFIFGKGRENGRSSDTMFTLMLIDCKTHWQPVVVAQIYEDRSLFKGTEDHMAGFSFPESTVLAEELMASFKCPAGKGATFVSKEAIVGDYGFGSGSNLQWVNIYTGATSMTFVSYGGELNLAANGTFTYKFTSASGAVGATSYRGATGSGTWSLSGDLLTCTFQKYDQGDGHFVKEHKYRIAGVTQFQDGVKVAVLRRDKDNAPWCTTLGDGSEWYSTKKSGSK